MGERARGGGRRGDGVLVLVVVWAAPTESSERRGRSVSRQRSAVGDRKNVGRSVSRQRSGVGDGRSGALCGGGSGGRIGSDASSRRRRSVSVVRCQISDSEVYFCKLLDLGLQAVFKAPLVQYCSV